MGKNRRELLPVTWLGSLIEVTLFYTAIYPIRGSVACSGRARSTEAQMGFRRHAPSECEKETNVQGEEIGPVYAYRRNRIRHCPGRTNGETRGKIGKGFCDTDGPEGQPVSSIFEGTLPYTAAHLIPPDEYSFVLPDERRVRLFFSVFTVRQKICTTAQKNCQGLHYTFLVYAILLLILLLYFV